MILTFLIFLIQGLFGALFYFLPVVTLADIPLIGDFVSETLTEMVLIWNAFIGTFPYAEIAWNIFLFVILPFEGLMLIAKFFLGHRLPAHTN